MTTYNRSFWFENDILYIHLSGNYPNEHLYREGNLYQPVIDACLAHNCKRSLIDARDLQIAFSTMEMFQAGKDAAYPSRIGIRLAFVARKDMLDPFFDDVVSNRGGDVGVFTDMDAARNWLLR